MNEVCEVAKVEEEGGGLFTAIRPKYGNLHGLNKRQAQAYVDGYNAAETDLPFSASELQRIVSELDTLPVCDTVSWFKRLIGEKLRN